MTIRAGFKFGEYKKLSATLEITMPIEDWIAFEKNINSESGSPTRWPVPQVRKLVGDMIDTADFRLRSTHEKEG